MLAHKLRLEVWDKKVQVVHRAKCMRKRHLRDLRAGGELLAEA